MIVSVQGFHLHRSDSNRFRDSTYTGRTQIGSGIPPTQVGLKSVQGFHLHRSDSNRFRDSTYTGRTQIGSGIPPTQVGLKSVQGFHLHSSDSNQIEVGSTYTGRILKNRFRDSTYTARTQIKVGCTYTGRTQVGSGIPPTQVRLKSVQGFHLHTQIKVILLDSNQGCPPTSRFYLHRSDSSRFRDSTYTGQTQVGSGIPPTQVRLKSR